MDSLLSRPFGKSDFGSTPPRSAINDERRVGDGIDSGGSSSFTINNNNNNSCSSSNKDY